MENFARPFLVLGVLFLLVGLFILYGNKIPFLNYLGKFPGDIRIEKENFKFYFPLTTSILVSVLISLILF
ncbi:PF11146 family protein [Leptospira interrogans serovar Icterohaemorrhagiae str. Verdun HP]|nr:PF11146 family protein [Leptospira interrogans serovar Icterohaemorrhagiae str. Verdun HP]